MRIQICHPSGYDFRSELYAPLRASHLNTLHEIVLPHETTDRVFSTRDAIHHADLVVAEISLPSTGLGMELAWASEFGKPIICMKKADSNPSSSISMIPHTLVVYATSEEMIEGISALLPVKTS